MSDLISRQAAIDAIKGLLGSMLETDTIGFYEIENVLFEVPSAQPDIIRCPDCYYNDGTAYCELHFRNVKAKDFCSWAERRE